MLQFDREPAFILKRTPYKENQYLLDLYSLNHGKLRAVARIGKQKTHRETESLAPFRELHISGRQKGELANLWHSDTIRSYPITGKDWLIAYYLNELLLLYAAPQADPALYQRYKQCLNAPEHRHLRHMEWYLIRELGLIPERSTEAPFYRLSAQDGWLMLEASKQGFAHELVSALEDGDIPLTHPQLKHYLQTLLSHHGKHSLRSKSTAQALMQLLRP